MGKLYDLAIEKLAGQPIDVLRSNTLYEHRNNIERLNNKATEFYSLFSVKGRGSVMRDFFVSHDKVNALFDDAISRK